MIKDRLVKAQKEKGVKALVRPAPMRWGTVQECFQSLSDSNQIITSIVSERDFISGSVAIKEKRQAIKYIVTHQNYRFHLEKAISILNQSTNGSSIFKVTKLPLVTFSKHVKTFQTNSTNLCYYQMKKNGSEETSRRSFSIHVWRRSWSCLFVGP